MAYDEHEHPEPEGGLYASTSAATPQRSALRRKQAVVGIVGAAAVLAGAGFLTTQLMSEEQPTVPEPAALAPQTSPAADGPTVEEAGPSVTRTPKSMKHAAPVERSPVASSATSGPASADPAAEARASEAVDKLRERLGISQRDYVSNRKFGDGTLRVVTARRDLLGKREMALAGNDGESAGHGVRCTDDIQSQPETPLDRPATLLCWRTSESRSVITITSATKDESLAAECADVINEEWARLE
jgi:hypothetical protein